MGFSRQEYWSELPFPSPGDLPNPGIEPRSPAFQAYALTSEPPGKLEIKELEFTAGNVKWYNHFRSSLDVFHRTKRRVMQLSVPPKELKICVYKKPTHTDVHNSFIHNCQNFNYYVLQ